MTLDVFDLHRIMTCSCHISILVIAGPSGVCLTDLLNLATALGYKTYKHTRENSFPCELISLVLGGSTQVLLVITSFFFFYSLLIACLPAATFCQVHLFLYTFGGWTYMLPGSTIGGW
jgi:hypothetical protein